MRVRPAKAWGWNFRAKVKFWGKLGWLIRGLGGTDLDYCVYAEWDAT
jgi:hypothetical protein